MIVLVTGYTGQLGKDVVNELLNRGHGVIAPDRKTMDLSSEDSIKSYLEPIKFDAVIHCAAWTNVDGAEDNVEMVYNVNSKSTQTISNVCKTKNAKMIYISTDYVFNGTGNIPWKPDDEVEPINVYGGSKYSGECWVRLLEKHYIVRVSWLFGGKKNFVNTMLLLKDKNEINVVNDQVGLPTYTKDLSRLLVDMVETDKYGTYNVSNEGDYISWYDFTKEIYSQMDIKTKVNPVSSADYPTKAKRPLNSRFDRSKLTENGFKLLPDWKDALKRFLDDKRA